MKANSIQYPPKTWFPLSSSVIACSMYARNRPSVYAQISTGCHSALHQLRHIDRAEPMDFESSDRGNDASKWFAWKLCSEVLPLRSSHSARHALHSKILLTPDSFEMTRWTNERISFYEELSADILLCLVACVTIAFSVRLQEKRRSRVSRANMDLPRALDSPSRSEGSQMLTAACNLSPLLISLAFALERHYTHNPYAQNGNLILIAGIPFTAQLYRLLRLISERLPDLQAEFSGASENSIIRKLSATLGAQPMSILLLLPSVAAYLSWCVSSHWLLANVLCLGNAIMLVVDLARIRSLRSACLLALVASVACYSWGVFEEFSTITSALDRTPLPLTVLAPTNLNMSSFLSLRFVDLIVPGIIVSFFRRFDIICGEVMQKNMGDLATTRYTPLYFFSVFGSIIGLAISLAVGFGYRTSQGTLIYTCVGSVLLPVLVAVMQRRIRTLTSFTAAKSPFILC
ncbi:histocompatibility 13 [Planoprotostelium fungivorum]|uniref:Histocompatibility 13 n=1 Tax=Planoprotostelium fungivorum TaxID=1890364 RepID=A0A2P6NGT5_9EUKA|nr:histocompatibility 13 [Planoprotostelium fungivorum]